MLNIYVSKVWRQSFSSITAVLHCCDIVFIFYVAPGGLVDSETLLWWHCVHFTNVLGLLLYEVCPWLNRFWPIAGYFPRSFIGSITSTTRLLLLPQSSCNLMQLCSTTTRWHCQTYIVEEQSRKKFYVYGHGEGKDTVTFVILLVTTKLKEITGYNWRIMITYVELENSWHVLFTETIWTVFDEIHRKHIVQICVGLCQLDMRTCIVQ